MFLSALQRNAERMTCARQARHDRSDRNVHDVGQLAIGETLKLAKREQVADAREQVRHRLLDEDYRVVVKRCARVWQCGMTLFLTVVFFALRSIAPV